MFCPFWHRSAPSSKEYMITKGNSCIWDFSSMEGVVSKACFKLLQSVLGKAGKKDVVLVNPVLAGSIIWLALCFSFIEEKKKERTNISLFHAIEYTKEELSDGQLSIKAKILTSWHKSKASWPSAEWLVTCDIHVAGL